MRVIAGVARGRRLEAPKGMEVRPTLDRVRESLFNILTPRLEGVAFLDLFAGSGANGIEALSRGAARATFVDRDERSLSFVRKNLQHAGLLDKARIVRATLPSGLERLMPPETPYGIVFADPPYAFDGYETLLRGVRESELLATDGVIVVEHAARLELPEEVGGYRLRRRNRYGEAALSFFSLDDAQCIW